MHVPASVPSLPAWRRHAPLGVAWIVVLVAFTRAFDVLIPSDVSNYLQEAAFILTRGLQHIGQGESRTAPGFPLLLAFSVKVGGLFAPYVLNLPITLAWIALAWIVYRALFPAAAATVCLAAVLALTLASTPTACTYMLQPFRESPTLLLCFGSLALATRRYALDEAPAAGGRPGSGLPWRYACAGGLLALACLVRETAVFLAPGLAVWILLCPGELPLATRLRRFLLFLSPFLAAGLAAGLWLALRGGWSGQLRHVLESLGNQVRHGQMGNRLAQHLPELIQYAWWMGGTVLWGASLVGAVLAFRERRLWLLTLIPLVLNAWLVLAFEVFPRYVMFTLLWGVPWLGVAWEAAARRWPRALGECGRLARWTPVLVAVPLVILLRLPPSRGVGNIQALGAINRACVEGSPVLTVAAEPGDRLVTAYVQSYLSFNRQAQVENWPRTSSHYRAVQPERKERFIEETPLFTTQTAAVLLTSAPGTQSRALRWLGRGRWNEDPASAGATSPVLRLFRLSEHGLDTVTVPVPSGEEGPAGSILWYAPPMIVWEAADLPQRRLPSRLRGWTADLSWKTPPPGDVHGPERSASSPADGWRALYLPAGSQPDQLTFSREYSHFVEPDPARLVQRRPLGEWTRFYLGADSAILPWVGYWVGPPRNPGDPWRLPLPDDQLSRMMGNGWLPECRPSPAGGPSRGLCLRLPVPQGLPRPVLDLGLVLTARRPLGGDVVFSLRRSDQVPDATYEPARLVRRPAGFESMIALQPFWTLPALSAPGSIQLDVQVEGDLGKAGALLLERIDVKWTSAPP